MSSSALTRQQFLHAAARAIAATSACGTLRPLLAAEDPLRVDDPLPEQIQKAWANRQSRWSRISCEISGYTLINKEVLQGIPGADPEEGDRRLKVHIGVWIDLEKTRVRWESLPGDQKRGSHVMAYDGQQLRGTDHQGQLVDLRRIAPALFELRYWPILIGHGLVGGPDDWLTPTRMRRTYDRDHFRVTAVKKSLVTLRSKPFGKSSAVLEYDVDTHQESLVVAARIFFGGQNRTNPSGEVQITESRDGLPVRWTYRSPALTEFLRIDRRELDPDFSNVEFHLDEA